MGEIVERWANRAIMCWWLLLIMAESEYIGGFHWLFIMLLLLYFEADIVTGLYGAVCVECWAPQSVYLCYPLLRSSAVFIINFFCPPFFFFSFILPFSLWGWLCVVIVVVDFVLNGALLYRIPLIPCVLYG